MKNTQKHVVATIIADFKIGLAENNTTALLMTSTRTIFPDAQPISVRVCTADIPFTACARDLGVMIPGNR